MGSGPIVQALSADAATLLALHAAYPQRYPALLESAAAGERLGRFDILFACPGERLTLHADGQLEGPHSEDSGGMFLRALDRWSSAEASPTESTRLPFTGGWFIYLGYELAGQIEPRLRLRTPERIPTAQAIRCPVALVHEHASGQVWLAAEPGRETAAAQVKRDLAQAAPVVASPEALYAGELVEDPPAGFLQAVERALEYIAAGEIYQANLSRGWRTQLRPTVAPAHVYARLKRSNPGPFSGIVDLGGVAVVSSSPERLLEVRGREAATRPIAGTRPRGATETSDRTLANELHAHPKERAEHVMLIDLERNDLGKVCERGSVQVDEFMTIESYAHVHHIVSNVRGRLRPHVTPGQAIAAVFPGGTITGCPKVRCMEIIAELEAQPRGPYTGAFGYLTRSGDMDLNILIRTLQVAQRQATFRAGAGIVADSIPERELEETRAKARGLVRALEAQTL